MNRENVQQLFDKWCRKLRLVPTWDIKLEFVEDPSWRKTGDFKIDCDDRKAVLMLNVANPKQENMEEVIIHELLHLKLYPLDQVTESLIVSTFEICHLEIEIHHRGLCPDYSLSKYPLASPAAQLKFLIQFKFRKDILLISYVYIAP